MTEKLNITLLEEDFQQERWRVLNVQGEPRAFNVEPLEAILKQEVSAAGSRTGVRFEDATYMDSTALGVLIWAWQQSKRTGGKFRVEFTDRLQETMRKLLGGGHGGDDDWFSGTIK